MAMVPISHSSSSMATVQPCFSYDVFLSFRGEDTRKNFTDHLYTALKQAGIRTFRDDDAMERGKLLKPELEKAIKESAISLIVFSEGYASSKWCLDEVLAIMKEHETSSSKHEVIPVFYKVEPSDVRNQTGSFKDTFDAYDVEIKVETDHEKKIELLVKLGAWRNSLRKAATLTGMVLVDGYEAKFIIDIVNVIRKKINVIRKKIDYRALYIEEKLVGIVDNVAEIELWLQDPLQDPSPEAVILLINGMGGIGKTTIAKCIFNSNSHNFDGSCFLANIDDTSNQPGGLLRLQSQLISTILKSDKEVNIWNDYEGTVKVRNVISNKTVLLILDDVATLKQLDALLGPKRFYPGSKVIITTRHKELSTAFNFHPEVQSVKTLSMDDAIKLFSSYAFDQDRPISPFIVQSKLFVRYCSGLPLALKVLGSSLRGKTIDVWEDTMRKLEAIPNPEIQKVLEISYETLADDKDKDLFLHLACFFVGEEKDYIVKLLAKCDLYPLVGIKNLMDRCLLDIEGGRVMMHQLIKKMGREVVRQESPKEPGKRSRLWHQQDCIDVLQDQTGTKKVEGLMLDMQKDASSISSIKMKNPGKRSFEEYLGNTMQRNDEVFKIGALEKMKNLKLLQLNFVTFFGRYKKLPRKLRLLSWHGFSLKAIPSDICLDKLVVLDMSYSKLKRVWDDYKVIGSLKILNLSCSVKLTKTPDFRGLPGLESLILKGCSSLNKIDKSIAYLKELVLLDLTNCTNLRKFPCFPASLVSLHLSGCRVLPLIQSLNSGPSYSHLVEMNLSYCNLFDNSFPSDWSSLVSIVRLNISGNNVTSLPKCIQTLPTIRHLNAQLCSNIQTILHLPESLKGLYVNYSDSLEKVQLTQDRFTTVYHWYCEKLCDIDGRFKVRSIDKVERKIIRYLGLELIAGEGIELGLQVLHEFGIFSTNVSGKLIPSGFMYNERGPQISFDVPRHDDSLRISGFNMCVVLSQSSRRQLYRLVIHIHNKTKALVWKYSYGYQRIPKNVEKYAWLSVWRCDNLLEAGDEISIRVSNEAATLMRRGVLQADFFNAADIVECGINLLYEDDEQLHEETEDAHNVSTSDQISWTDRMDSNISDYVYSGSMISFRSACYKPEIHALPVMPPNSFKS